MKLFSFFVVLFWLWAIWYIVLFGAGVMNKTFCHTATNTLYFEATKTPVFMADGTVANCDIWLLSKFEREDKEGGK